MGVSLLKMNNKRNININFKLCLACSKCSFSVCIFLILCVTISLHGPLHAGPIVKNEFTSSELF